MALKSSTIREVKVPVSMLRIGMFVCRLDKDWVDSSFIFQGFLITDESLIKQLAKECDYVYIDEKRGEVFDKTVSAPSTAKPTSTPKVSFFGINKLFGRKDKQTTRQNTVQLIDIVERKVNPATIVPPPKLVTFDVEMTAAKEAHATAGSMLQDFMANIKQGGAVDISVAKQAVYDCMNSMLRTPDAMLLITRLKQKNFSVWQHSMNVSVLAINLGRYLNLHDDELVLLGLCGMFHDVGKLMISKEALESSSDRTGVINTHPTLGRDILSHCMGQLAQVASEVAYSHHEWLDGSGFPRGLESGEISPYTRMISIVNIYDNLTTDKPDRKALTHYEAITQLLKKGESQLDETLVNSFNQCIGTYPVGCVVELNTGEIAMVVEDNGAQKLRPKILLLTTPDKVQRTRTVVNLADDKFSKTDDFCFIKAIVRAETYGIKL